VSLVLASDPTSYRPLPTVWEMRQPFQIDNGEVGYTGDPSIWARDHIMAYLLTTPGERVMRPTYGAGLRAFVFENHDAFTEATLISQIQEGIQHWEPSITVNNIEINPLPPDWGTFEFRVMYQVGSIPTGYTLTFSISAQGVEVMR
jgi:phage baseplate assembly protein W